jgi:hypothetical protein
LSLREVPFPFSSRAERCPRANPNEWDKQDDDISILVNNWFEFIYENTSDERIESNGIMCNEDLAEMSDADLEEKMLEICKKIAGAQKLQRTRYAVTSLPLL